MKMLATLFLIAASAVAADFRAGVARVKITPKTSYRLSGYPSRNKPSEGTAHHLWSKALALQDSSGGRVVIVTTDLIGFPRAISEAVAARVQDEYGLDRAALLLNSSHTHTGPLLRSGRDSPYNLNEEERQNVAAYGRRLTDDLVSLVGTALGKLAPADLAFGHGKASFAVNRRQLTADGFRIGVNLEGPTDHSVPVLRATDAKGKVLAVVFGYACHNTTLSKQFYKFSGDYAGFAQIELEKSHPGATAMFLMLCGGDQNPKPWRTLELAEEHGKSLAQEVDRVLAAKLQRIKGPIRVALQIVEPSFTVRTRATFERWLTDSNRLRVRHARYMLRTYEEGRPMRRIPYPVQAIRFDNSLTMVALGGEVVVDYALRIKRDYPGENTVVAGYSNDVMCYIPSARVLKEGGYEADTSMIYYGQPGPFNEKVEEIIFDGIHQAMKKVGRTPGH